MKSEKSYARRASFVVFIILCIAISVIGFFSKVDRKYSSPGIETFNEGWTCSYTDNEKGAVALDINLPINLGVKVTDEGVIIKNTLPDDVDGKVFVVQSFHQDFSVYIDGALRFSYGGDEERLFGHTSPSGFFYFPMYAEDEGKEVSVAYQSYYEEYRDEIKNIYIGTEGQFLTMMYSRYKRDFYMAAVMAAIGLTCIVAYFLLYFFNKKVVDFNYLGYFGFIAAFLMLWASGGRQIIVHDIFFADKAIYTLSACVLIPLIQFIDGRQEHRFKVSNYIACMILTINTFVVVLLDVFSISDTAVTCSSTYVLNLIAVAYLVIILLIDLLKKRIEALREIYLGVIVFAGFSVVGAVRFFALGGAAKDVSLTPIYLGFIAMMLIFAAGNLHIWIRMENAQKSAYEANRAKSDFLANMSHEIRTPINAVLGMNEMIQRETQSENIRLYSNKIKNAGNILLSIVNDILDFSKLESGKMELVNSEYETVAVFYDVINMAKSKIEDKNIELLVDIDPKLPVKLFGDDVKLRQIITNILSNAAKYTRQGSIRLKVEAIRSAAEYESVLMKVSVKDTGIGIKAEDMPRLFESFRRIDEKYNRTIEGTGLGMTITNSLLRLMNSELKVQSVYGEGSEFWFEVRQSIINPAEIKDFDELLKEYDRRDISVHSKFVAPKAQILVVDDNEMNLEVISGLLKETEVKVTLCERGSKALELVRNNKYNLVLMDHMMPGMDGIEALRRIREFNNEIPVVVLTANAIGGAREMYLEKGFQDYLVKPVDLKELEIILRKYIPSSLIMNVSESAMKEKNRQPQKEEIKAVDNNRFLDKYGINVDEGVKYSAGKVDKYKLMLETYKKFDASRRMKLEGLIHEKDVKGYAIEVHALKGNARGIGAVRLADMALEHELKAKEDNIQYVTDNFEKLIKELDDTLESIDHVISELFSSEEKRSEDFKDKAKSENASVNVERKVTEREIANNETLADKEKKQSEYLEKLYEYVGDFDHKSAIMVIDQWIAEENDNSVKMVLGLLKKDLSEFEFEKTLKNIKLLDKKLFGNIKREY